MRGSKTRISFGSIMFNYEYLFSHFSPVLGWNIASLQNTVLDKLICLVHLFLAPVKDGITCRHVLPLGTRWLKPGLL